MTKLEWTFRNDVMFKSLFTQRPDILKRLVAALMSIPHSSIGQFEVTNPEMPPDIVGDKFCRLDINMTVDGQRVDLEVQVANEGDYPERSLYYWAREYSSALGEGGDYAALPRTVVLSILDFRLFDCEELHSEFCPLEVSRHTLLTEKMSLHYFELPKLPEDIDADDELKLWLALFNAETEEELQAIEALGVLEMKQAIVTYRHIVTTPEFRALDRMRADARHNEASALSHARREGRAVGREEERQKWQGVVADKDAALAEQSAALAEQSMALADKDATIAQQAAALAKLLRQLGGE